MTQAGPTSPEVTPDDRPAASLLVGIGRGALLVFLPVFAIGQALAWTAAAVTGWYGPSTWARVGLAESLTGAHVAFDATAVVFGGSPQLAGELAFATGAVTIAIVVLAFRAGRAQAAGLEDRPLAAAAAASAVGLGFALPTFLTSFGATLTIDRFGIDRLEPLRWQSLVFPAVIAGAAAVVGALGLARQRVEERIGERVVAAVRGGAIAFWWGLVLALVGALLAAALSPSPVATYARALDRAGAVGAAAIVQQALLAPNGSALVLATSMGATTTFVLGPDGEIEVTREGVHAEGVLGGFVAAVLGANGPDVARFPWWFAGWWLVPAAATVVGGRAAAGRAARAEGALRGALSGAVYAVLCAVAVWAASITVPTWGLGRAGEITIGTSPILTGALALAWGVIGGTVGGTVVRPAKMLSARERPR
jgi:hypothetical protein